jgi:hypothetical protein
MFDLDTVYFDTALEEALQNLPGTELSAALRDSKDSMDDAQSLQWKLEQCCRKLCLMWQAAEWALEAEEEFYTCTFHDSPALFGHEAVTVHYHLEAFVLFARSALDLSANVFGALLPDPFPRGRYDSFNRLVKTIERGPDCALKSYLAPLRLDASSWVSIVSGSERGRSLRDRISHQTEFPIAYEELNPHSEKEYAVVWIDRSTTIPLPDFIDALRNGVLDGFATLERASADRLRAPA